MIAASEPQEFVPRGRQQVLAHPGPVHMPLVDSLLREDLILSKMQRVSISHHYPGKFERQLPAEWWTLRKAPVSFLQEDHLDSDEVTKNNDRMRTRKHNGDPSEFETSNCDSAKIADNDSYSKENSTRNFLEEELYVQGCTAVWSRGLACAPDGLDNGRKTLYCYTTPKPILQAAWCTLYRERPCYDTEQREERIGSGVPISAVCIVTDRYIRFYTENGEDYGLAMPWGVSSVRATCFGVLIEKDPKDDLKDNSSLDTGRFSREQSLANLYFLAYPLDDISPIAVESGGTVQLFQAPYHKVVHVSEHPSICMVYDSLTKQHLLYRIRRLRVDEKADFADRVDSLYTTSLDTSCRLKNRLSVWDHHKPSHTPSPRSSSLASLGVFQHNSRSHSSMATMSRCQSPSVASSVSSPWPPPGTRPNQSYGVESQGSIRGKFFDCSKTMSHLRTHPCICLEHLWTDQYNSGDGSMGAASKVFFVEDISEQWYLCYIIPSKQQLSMVRVDFSNPKHIIFGMVTSVSAKDAVPIPHLRMLAILEFNGNVMLYSGLTAVGKLHIGGVLTQHTPSPFTKRTPKPFNHSPFPRRSSMLPHCSQPEPRFDEHLLSPVTPLAPLRSNIITRAGQNILQMSLEEPRPAVLSALRDPVEDRLTLQYSDGTSYRVTLPPMSRSPLVDRCLKALTGCLIRDVSLTLHTKWYASRNTLGTEGVTHRREWEMFTTLLFELLGYQEPGESPSKSDSPTTPGGGNPKRVRCSDSGSDDDWFHLIATDHYQTIYHDLMTTLCLPKDTLHHVPQASCSVQVNPHSLLFPYIRLIHTTLHLLYEDMKLNVNCLEQLELLVLLLSKLAGDMGLREWSLHYWKDFPELCKIPNVDSRVISEDELKGTLSWESLLKEKPFDIMEFIDGIIVGRDVTKFPYIEDVNERSKNIIRLCGLMNQSNSPATIEALINPLKVEPDKPNPDASFVRSTREEQVVMQMVEMGITTRYLDTLPAGVYFILYNVLWQCRENPPGDWPPEAYFLLWREDLAAQALKFKREDPALDRYGMYSQSQLQELVPCMKQSSELDQPDGMEDVDNPLMKLRYPEDVRVSEARRMLQSSRPVPVVLRQRPDVSDHDFIEEQEKHLYAVCTRTMALPVGRGMLTLRTVTPVVTEPLPTPPLCLSGRAPPRGTTVELTHIDTPPNMSLWPLFHNGAANGLRITPDAHNIDNNWIIFNRPTPGSGGGGKASATDQQMEHAGFLMALGLNGHLKNLAVLDTFEYLGKVHEMTSVGILLGLAAAFRGTAHPGLTKTLSIHVEALLPPTSMEVDVPQSLQVAGLMGIGLVYQGTSHRRMTEVLLSEIGRPPGPEMENSVDRESYSLAAGLALGLVTLGQGGRPSGLSDLNVPDMLRYYMVGGNKRPFIGAQKDKYKVASFQIREGCSVNLDVTAPGATLALGLMYLSSGNKAVADWMAPPETQYLLDFVRPDFLMLRILARALILWDDIEPSKEWVENQVPGTIRPHCMVKPSAAASDVDYEAMNQAYCNIITGACMAIGLKYAGSSDEGAFTTLLHFCHMFTSLAAKSIAELAGKPTIETCLNALLISVSMVMAGTGNLEIMRLIRFLRRRVGVASSTVVTYGSHLAIHMSLGLLFLGAGRFTLSNRPESIAALLCAFYPKWPTHSNDNRYHLQAFRHLYVLAVEPRLVIPKDVRLGKSCYATLRLVKLNGSTTTVKGPGIIPALDTLQKVAVDDERYWPVTFERGRNWDQLKKILETTGYIEVKQRAGCLSYTADKLGYHSQLARTLTRSEVLPWDPPSSAIVAFTGDQAIRHFCDHYLQSGTVCQDSTQGRLKQMLTRVTYDAVVKDKLPIVPAYAALLKFLVDLETSPNVFALRQFKLIFSQTFSPHGPNFVRLLSSEMLLAITEHMDLVLDQWEPQIATHVREYLAGDVDILDYSVMDSKTRSRLALYVSYYDLPFNCQLESGSELEMRCRLASVYADKTVNKIVQFMSA